MRWHYQWIIVHEFLPKTVGADLVDDIIDNGRQFYRWRNDPFIPVEFSVAAYRFGHSQVRPSYRANFGTSATDPTKQFFGLIFDATQPAGPDPDDLRGGVRAPRRFVDWQTFFDFGDGRARHNKKIDTTLSTPLFNLLGFAAGDNDSLASRNLLRNLVFGVPSGQSVARAMNQTPLPASELARNMVISVVRNGKRKRENPYAANSPNADDSTAVVPATIRLLMKKPTKPACSQISR